MPQPLIQRSFVGGEVSPALWLRADLAKYQTGLALCRNMIVLRQGGVTKRPGTKYITRTKNDGIVRLVPFVDEANDASYLLEFGQNYVRFIWHDAPVLVAGVPYEVVTPYSAGDVATLQFSQYGNVLSLAHASHPPAELIRLAHTNWPYTVVSVQPGIAPPQDLTANHAIGNPGTLNMQYVVTAVKAQTFEESYASAAATALAGAEPTVIAPNLLTWTAVDGAAEYNVYCNPYGNGIFGYVGRADGTSFKDVGFLPNYNITPPEAPTNPTVPGFVGFLSLLFTGANNYPAVVAHHQQRTWYARTNNFRETTWGSQVGIPHNFARSTPLQDDDALEFIVNAQTISPVLWLVSVGELVLLSDAGAYRILGDGALGGAITPASITPRQDTWFGASQVVRPTVVGDTLIFIQARGSGVRDIRYSQSSTSLVGNDLTAFAAHLTRGFKLTDLTFQLEPSSVIWSVRDDGLLLGCTYIQEQEIVAWHRHATGASGRDECADWEFIERLAVLPNNLAGQDVLYWLVRRTIGGQQRRYIERLANEFHPERTPIEEAFFVDAGITYDGVATTTIVGLEHLEGRVVAVLADGVVRFNGDPNAAGAGAFTVASGAITLPVAASLVHVGLAIRFADFETLDLDVGDTRDKRKRINHVTLQIYGTSTDLADLLLGPDAAHLRPVRREHWKPSETWRTGAVDINVTASYKESGRVRVRHVTPLPFTAVGIIPSADIGG